MGVFDIFNKQNKSINRLCHYFYVSRKEISPFLISLIENNPTIVDLMCSDSVSVDLFNKINSNNYSILDMKYENLKLFRLLPRTNDIQRIIDIFDKKINIDSVYQCFFCDDISSIYNQEQVLERKVSSFFDNIEILADSKKVCKLGSSYNGNICIYSDSSENDIFFYNGKKYISKDVLKDSIITMNFDYFIKLVRDKRFIEFAKKLKIVFQENYKDCNKLIENTTEVSNWITHQKKLLLKTNHLLYVIKNSYMLNIDKEYYIYLVSKIFGDRKIGISDKEHKIEIIAKQISYKVKFNILRDITERFDNESSSFKNKEIDKTKYNLSVLLKENNLTDLTQVSEDSLNCLLSELNDDELNEILNCDELIDKYTTRTVLNISFKDLYSLEDVKSIIKNIVNTTNNNKKDIGRYFDINLIYNTIVNGLLFLIKNSMLDDSIKEYYEYLLKREYLKISSSDKCEKYIASVRINNILKELVNKIGEYDSKLIINNYNDNLGEKKRKIGNPIFSANIFISEIGNFDNIKLSDLTYKLSNLTLSELMVVLSSDEILNKYNSLYDEGLTKEEKKKIILREIKIGEYNFNDDIINFIKRNNIDLDNFYNMPEATVRSYEDINPIARKYAFFHPGKNKDISIGKVLGHDEIRNSQNIFSTMSLFFDSHGDGYHTRSVGLLDYSSEEIMKNIKDSFKYEPIKLSEVDKDTYIIAGNGLHRFTALRLNYILELMDGKKREDVDSQFTFNAIVEKVDFFKTYCNYLLCHIDDSVDHLSCVFNDDFKVNYDIIKVFLKDGKNQYISNEELYNRVVSKTDNISARFMTDIEFYYKKIPSFKDFIDNYFQDIKLKFIDKGDINVGIKKSK